MQPQWKIDQVSHEFDADNFDSDGDGYSNLFERATGMDSLGYDQQNAPLLTESPEGRPRISFVRYSNLISATGEDFDYIIEESFDLRSWMPATVTLEDQINVGGGMERYTYLASESLQTDAPKFLRLRIEKAN